MGGAPDRLALAFLGDVNSIHFRRWAAWFADRGHRVTLLIPEGQVMPSDIPSGVGVEWFSRRLSAVPWLGLVATGLSVRRAVARLRPDVLHVHHLTVHGIRAWMSGFHPYVVTVWGTDVLVTVRHSRRARLLARRSLRGADLVTGISRHVVEAAIEAGARPESTRVIHFGIDVGRFSPGKGDPDLRKRLGLNGKRVVFSPRTIAALYRHDVAIDALAQLPQDVALVMTRHLADPDELARVEARIAERGLAERVVILPSVPYGEMPGLYRLSDVVLSVPESDAGPITLVEALSTGRPAVCSDLPPTREWLADLDPACLVPVGDAGATAGALASVLDRGARERAGMAELGRARVLERADQDRTMAEMETLYRALAAGRSPRPAVAGREEP